MKRLLLCAVAFVVSVAGLQAQSPDVGYTMWLMSNGTTRTVRVFEAEYDRFAIVNRAVGDAPGRPSADAVFLMAVGGVDGSQVPAWEYRFAQASDPGRGTTSVLTEKVYDRNGVRTSQRVIPNHRSVTFDASSSGTAGAASSLTVSHTVTSSQSNLYIAGLVVVHANTLSSSSFNGTSMTTRDSNTATNFRPYLSDLVNPSTGTHNCVFTPNTKSDMAGGCMSAYGVDQTTPRRATANNSGTSTSPTITVTSATGDLAISTIGYDGSLAIDTADGFWVTSWTLAGAGNTNSIGQHISGASPSQVRNDSFNNSAAWALVAESIQAVATTTRTCTLALLGVGPCH